MEPNLQLIKPQKCLEPYIECYWSWRITPVERERDAIFPDASTELIIHLAKPPKALKDNDVWIEQPRNFLSLCHVIVVEFFN